MTETADSLMRASVIMLKWALITLGVMIAGAFLTIALLYPWMLRAGWLY